MAKKEKKEKKPHKKVAGLPVWAWVVIVCVFMSWMGSLGRANMEKDVEAEDTEVVEEVKGADYDDLQNMFVRITPDSKPEDIESMVSEYGLHYTENKGSYKVAYTEGTALQKYADSGDYIQISFNDDGMLLYADYSNASHRGTSLLYNGGTFYQMYNVDESYYGYYYVNSMDTKKNGVKIHDHDSYFYLVEDAYEAIDSQMNS